MAVQSNLLKRELKIDMLAHIKHSLKDRTPNGSSADELDLMDQVYTTLENHKDNIEAEFERENQEIEQYQSKRNKETEKKLEYSKSLIKNRKPREVGSPREISIQIASPGGNSDISLEEPINEVLEEDNNESLQEPVNEEVSDVSNNIQNI